MVSTPGNRKRIVIIVAIAWFSQWSGNGLVSFYLNKVFDTIGITSPTVQLLITGSAIYPPLTPLRCVLICQQYSRHLEPVLGCICLLPRGPCRPPRSIPDFGRRYGDLLQLANRLFCGVCAEGEPGRRACCYCIYFPILCRL